MVEILVVVAAFSVLGILVARSVLLTVQGARKSEATVRVRENVNYAMDIIQRQIRNAETITTTPCDGSSVSSIVFTDKDGVAASFACNVGAAGYIAWGSARLTSSDIGVTACSFSCTTASGNIPASVTVSVTASDLQTSGIETAQSFSTTKIYLRTY